MTATGAINKLPFGNLPPPDPGLGCAPKPCGPKTACVDPGARRWPKFMRRPWGSIPKAAGAAEMRVRKLRNQMRRLFGCTVTLIYKEGNEEQFVNSTAIALIARGK